MTPTQQPYDEWISNMERLESLAPNGPWRKEDGVLQYQASDYDYPNIKQWVDLGKVNPMRGVATYWDRTAEFIVHSRSFIPRAIEELRKRDRAIEIAKKSIRCTCEFHKIHGSDGPCNGCVALQQIEEVLK